MLRLAGVGDEDRCRTGWSRSPARRFALADREPGHRDPGLGGDRAVRAAPSPGFVALAVLMPIVASMGGNAGTQTLTVAVRAIGDARPDRRQRWRGASAARCWSGWSTAVIFAAMIGAAGLGLVRLADAGRGDRGGDGGQHGGGGLRRGADPDRARPAGLDPALASGTFVTTMTDVFGFFAFLGLAGADAGALKAENAPTDSICVPYGFHTLIIRAFQCLAAQAGDRVVFVRADQMWSTFTLSPKSTLAPVAAAASSFAPAARRFGPCQISASPGSKVIRRIDGSSAESHQALSAAVQIAAILLRSSLTIALPVTVT